MAFTAGDIEAADFDPIESLAISNAFMSAQNTLSKAYARQAQASTALQKAQNEKTAADAEVALARSGYFEAAAAIANMMDEKLTF